jgi:hypothetical protein
VEWRGGKRDDMNECFERWRSERDGMKEWGDGLQDTKANGISINKILAGMIYSIHAGQAK